MTAREQCTNAIAHRLASQDGRKFEKLSPPEQLSYERFADSLLGMIEHKMAAQGKQLSEQLREVWNLPA